MTLERISGLLPKTPNVDATRTAREWKEALPQLADLDVSDQAILRALPLLISMVDQDRVCGACQGYATCAKMGDAKGMYDHLTVYGGELTVTTSHCQAYREHVAVQRAARFQAHSSRTPYDKLLSFSNFPIEQRKRIPQIYNAAVAFADSFQVPDLVKGIYVCGPAGVGKSHLLHAIVNRLEERMIPSIIVQAEALFDRLRSLIGAGEDIEPVLETFSTIPVLAIDEIGQERANEFTLEKMFRIINHRFSAKLPTLFASNYAPPDLYRRVSEDLLPLTDPLRSRIIGMSRISYLAGEDHRVATMDLLDWNP